MSDLFLTWLSIYAKGKSSVEFIEGDLAMDEAQTLASIRLEESWNLCRLQHGDMVKGNRYKRIALIRLRENERLGCERCFSFETWSREKPMRVSQLIQVREMVWEWTGKSCRRVIRTQCEKELIMLIKLIMNIHAWFDLILINAMPKKFDLIRILIMNIHWLIWLITWKPRDYKWIVFI
jgi:hypothetical protein